jgi:hypothetical protein
MAKPIQATPIIYGKDAEKILDEIKNGTPDTLQRIEFIRRADELFKKISSQLRRKEGQLVHEV